MDEQSEQEMYRLARENNKMLHSMRRNAFWGGILKFILYGLLLLAPIWFYMTYLNSTVQNLLQTMNRIQGTTQQAQSQFSGIEASWKQFEAKFGFGSATSTQ
jgi:hypothetical protein